MKGFALLAMVVVLAACQQQNDAEPAVEPSATVISGPIVAEVNGVQVPEDVLMAFIRLRNHPVENDQQREQALKQLTDLYLLAQDAERSGLTQRRTVAAELEVQRLSSIATRAMSEFSRANPINDEAVRSEYDAGLSTSGSREYRVRHILVAEEARSQMLIEKLSGGMDFGELEQSLVSELGLSNAGEIGWINVSQVPESFSQALTELTPGSHTGQPVHTEYGWHVIRLEEVRDLAPPPFEEVQANIRAGVAKRQVEQYLNGLREAAGLGQAAGQ